MFRFPLILVSLLTLGVACSVAPKPPGIKSKSGANGGTGNDDAGASKLSIPLQNQAAASSFPRLSHSQWENTVKDLFYLDKVPGLSKDFADDPGGSLFGNNGVLFSVSANQRIAYRNAAEALAERIAKDAALFQKLIPKAGANAKEIVTHFLTRAYRRLPASAEVDTMLAVFEKGTKINGVTDAQKSGLAAVITVVLQSPYFLYRVELGSKESGRYVTLDAYELASRLSYSIWNTMPDDALFALAKSNELLKPDVLHNEVERMLKDPRSSSLLTSIHMKGYGIDRFKVVPQDLTNYPESAALDTESVRREAELFVEDVVVKSGKGISEIFTAPYAFVSAKSAPVYEVAESSEQPKKVNLDPEQRAGILSQVAFLSNYSKPEGLTSIIRRGHYVAENVLCTPFKGAPPVVDDITAGDFKTNRERISAMTEKGSCAGCHTSVINPPGFGLENFGPAGKWRVAERNGSPIDASGEYAFKNDTIGFDGPVALAQEIVKRQEFHQCYAQKLVEGLYGRYADTGDAALIRKVGSASLKGASAKDLFLMILTDPLVTLRSNE